MQTVTTIGLDLAKSVLQVHGVDGEGAVVVRRALRRSQVLDFFRRLPPCLVGLEACSSSHYWAREIRACGHRVRMIPPIYVKAYVKRGKTDAADAEAICEAGRAPRRANDRRRDRDVPCGHAGSGRPGLGGTFDLGPSRP